METSEGQGVIRIQLKIDGDWETVFPTWRVAELLCYDRHYITHLCDTGQLIATKFSGRWWVHEAPMRILYPNALPHHF